MTESVIESGVPARLPPSVVPPSTFSALSSSGPSRLFRTTLPPLTAIATSPPHPSHHSSLLRGLHVDELDDTDELDDDDLSDSSLARRRSASSDLLVPHSAVADSATADHSQGYAWEDEIAVPRGRSASQQARLKEREEEKDASTERKAVTPAGKDGAAAAATREREKERLDRLHSDYAKWLSASAVEQSR